MVWIVQVVEKYSSNAAVEPPVLDSKVLVTPSLEVLIILWVMFVTGSLQCLVEISTIIFFKIVGSKVTHTSKPPSFLT